MDPMYLRDVEGYEADNEDGERIRNMKAAGIPVPQILHLIAFKPHTKHLTRFTQGVMRGPSPLSAGMRELIAAFTSRQNDCFF